MQSAMLRRSQMWQVTPFRHYAIVRRQSTFTSETGKALGPKLSSRLTLASPSLQALSVQLYPRTQARTLQTTTQSSVDSPWSFPADAKTAEVAELLASLCSDVEDLSQSDAERRILAAREHLGTRVFEWVKQLEALDQQLAISKEFWWDLCWFLLAEGEESAFVEFLMNEATIFSRRPPSDMKQQYYDQGVIGYRMRRNHGQLTGLMDAHVSLSTDGTTKDGLECLLAMHRAAREKKILYALTWAGSYIVLSHHLMRAERPPCDKELFDQFCHFMRGIMNPPDYERSFAFIMLYHPNSPDPCPALRVLKNQLRGLLTHRKTRSSRGFYGATLLRAAFIRHSQGTTSETQWARSVLQMEFRRTWKQRHAILDAFEKDPKLQHLPGLRKAAKAFEVDDGRDGKRGLPILRQEAKSESLLTQKYVK